MTATDWREAARSFRRAISLGVSPVGVKLLKADEVGDYSSLKTLDSTAICQMLSMARYAREEGISISSSDGQKCVWGASCLGLMETPQRLKKGELNLIFTKDEAAAINLQNSMFMLGNKGKQYSAVLVAPLDLMPVKPDVVVIYLTPAQVLRLIIAFAYDNGEPVRTTMTGQASVCSAIALAVEKGEVSIDIPCMGDRAYGLVQEQELVMVFPASKMRLLLDGLEATEFIASYPFRPFLGWSVVFPPSFEPKDSEL